jgi:LysR family transcriptional regulator, hca operon transcriptional activator
MKPVPGSVNLALAGLFKHPLMSLVESSGGVGLAPLYVKNMLIPSVVARPLQGESPTIDLMMGYNKSNSTPLLKRFLSRADEIVEHVSQKENLLSAKKRKIGAA